MTRYLMGDFGRDIHGALILPAKSLIVSGGAPSSARSRVLDMLIKDGVCRIRLRRRQLFGRIVREHDGIERCSLRSGVKLRSPQPRVRLSIT